MKHFFTQVICVLFLHMVFCWQAAAVTSESTDDCATPKTLNFTENFDGDVFPPACWTNSTGIWKKTSTGTNPTCTPHSGNGMIRFEKAANGATAWFVTPKFYVNNSKHSLYFWIYRDGASSYQEDRVNIYFSVAPMAIGNPILTIHQTLSRTPVESRGAGWYQYHAELDGTTMTTGYVIFEGVGGHGSDIYIDDVVIGDVCDPITNLTGTNMGETGTPGIHSISLKWTAPNNGAVTGYNVYRGTNRITSTPLTSTTTSYSDNVMAGDYAYEVEALYSNACGKSDKVKTNVTVGSTCGNQPKEPSYTVNTPNWYSVNLTWKAPDSMGEEADLKGYIVCRDGVQINNTLLGVPNLTDKVSRQGVYTYTISAAWDNGCVSAPVSIIVDMPVNPCDVGHTVFPYIAGFEGNKFPDCSKQEIVNGGTSWGVITASGNPSTTHGGSYKARFINQTNAGQTAKLILPKFDFSGLEKPMLSFWYANNKLSSSYDSLRVYYKSREEGDWILLKNINTSSDNGWNEVILRLPEPTANYWIAFEAISGRGAGIHLDDIKVGTGSTTGFHADDVAALKAFFLLTSTEEAKNNGAQLNIEDAENWGPEIETTGMTWNNEQPKRLTAISWTSKKLAGALDLSKSTSVATVTISKNKLTSLKFPAVTTALTTINLLDNAITELVLPIEAENLLTIELQSNQIKNLTLPEKVDKMTSFRAQNVGLETLTIPGNLKALVTFWAPYNKLKVLTLPTTAMPDLTGISCHENRELEQIILPAGDRIPKIATFNCQNSKLKFSTLPKLSALIGKSTFAYSPQAVIQGSCPKYTDGIDLSSEHKTDIGGYIETTVYNWFDITDGTEVAVTSGITPDGTGKFALDASMAGKKLRCKMTNANYPKFTSAAPLVYEVEIGEGTPISRNEVENISIYPNPASSYINVSGENIDRVEVYNLMGKHIETIIADKKNISIDVAGYVAGMYFLKIQTTDNQTISKRVIVNP